MVVIRGSLQIFCQRLEFAEGDVGTDLALAHAIAQAMLDMVLDQFALGIVERVLDCVNLLRQVNSRPPRLEHREY